MNGERRSSGRLLVAAVVTLVLSLAAIGVVTASGLVPSVAPANPRFVTYLNDLAAGRAQETTNDGHALGLVPLPVDLPAVKPKQTMRTLVMGGLPSTFDWRTKDKLTPVKDQMTCGSCWAFATCGSLESSLKPSETWDFSENNMKNKSGFDLGACDGGNYFMSTAYLARWDGPVVETDDPYNPDSAVSPQATTTQKHLQSVDFLPDRTGPLDNDTLKRAVMTYGAIYTSLYWTGGYYKPDTYAYYYTGTGVVNHAVCIVGWDDNFDRTQFSPTPPGNGAFLIKNSWGSSWGMDGYFWVSYYDSKIGTENAEFKLAEPTINYDHIYQYDPLGWVRSIGYGNSTASFANVFTATSDEALNAISFYTPVPDSTYEVDIYTDPSDGPTNSTGPVTIQTGTISNPGYQTVQLNPAVSLNPGQKFSSVVKLTSPGYNYPIPMETVSAGYSSTATANPGESYISATGDSWTDATTSYPNANVCLKAFTSERTALVVTQASGLAATGPVGGPFSPAIQAYTLTNDGTEDIGWTASKNQPWIDISASDGTLAPGESVDVAVSLGSDVYSMGSGAYTGTVEFINETGGTGSTSRTVSVLVKDGTLSVTPQTGLSSSGEPHGPFTPGGQTYTLKNTGYGNIGWAASKSQPWVALSSENGTLAPGESVDVEVSIGANAGNLPTGDFSDVVAFTNTTNGDGDTTRSVNLSIVRNYDMTCTTFDWIDPTYHSSFILSDDGVTSPQSIPFAFSFYGTSYSQVYVGANGLLGFVNNGLNEFRNTDIPDLTLPNAAIYPYWDDLNPNAGGRVSVGTAGIAPNRKMVISWVGVPSFSSPNPLSFQVLLCETTGNIIFQYQEVQPGDASAGAGIGATIGLENATGSVARKYSYNGSALLSNGLALLFNTNHGVSISETMRMAGGVACDIGNATVSATPLSNLFYIEAEDRSCGISVYYPAHGLSQGDKVDIVGTTSTNSSGEKFISATSVTPTGETGNIIKPLCMRNAFVGGDDWFYDPNTKAGQRGVGDACGLNNIGLLISTPGRVTYSNGSYFYIDDGSKCKDNSANTGIKVLGSVPVTQGEDPVGEYVIVTGVSSCFKGTGSDTKLYRLIRATDVSIVDD